MKADLCFHSAGRWNLEEASSQLHNRLWSEKAWLPASLPLGPLRLSGTHPRAADGGRVSTGEQGAPGSNLSDGRWGWEEGVFCTLYIGHTFVKTVFWNKIFFS